MKKLIYCFTLFFLLIGLNSGANAFSNFNGTALLQACNDAVKLVDNEGALKDPTNGALCIGYVSGFNDMELMNAGFSAYSQNKKEISGEDHLFYCTPSNNSTYQNVKIVIAYLEKHPESLHRSAASLTLMALAEAFPCKKE